MIKSKKENLKIAKKIFQGSFAKGTFDEAKVLENISLIKKAYKSRALAILKVYLTLLKRHLSKDTLIVETSQRLNPQYLKEIKLYFEKDQGRKLQVQVSENKDLIGGLRIVLGDTLFDLSVKGKIEQIKEALLR